MWSTSYISELQGAGEVDVKCEPDYAIVITCSIVALYIATNNYIVVSVFCMALQQRILHDKLSGSTG